MSTTAFDAVPDVAADAIRDELTHVLDPCSVHNGTRLSFVDLGMVHSIDVDAGGHAIVRMLLDDPVCMYLVDIMTSVRDAALGADGINSVDVEIVGDEFWTPDRLTADTVAKMNRWQVARESRRSLPLTSAGQPAVRSRAATPRADEGQVR